MSAIYRKISATKWAFTGIFILIACLVIAYVAFAQGRTVTMKCKSVIHITQIETVEAGDVPGHLLHAGANQGLSIFDKGELATYKGWWLWEVVEGSDRRTGSGHGYGVTTFEDGSTIVTQFKGSETEEQRAGKYVHEEKGTITITNGTGRFKGIKGTGTYAAKRIAPEADLYVEETLTYTLP